MVEEGEPPMKTVLLGHRQLVMTLKHSWENEHFQRARYSVVESGATGVRDPENTLGSNDGQG